MKHENEINDRYVIKNASLRIDDFVFFIASLILLYFIIEGQNIDFLILAFIGLLGYTTYRIIKRFQDRSEKIIIDRKGIKLCETNEFINWSKIKYAYIKQKSEGVGKSARVVDYFIIDTRDGEFSIQMTDYAYKKDLLVKVVESFSGRNIGELTDMISDTAKKIIGNERNIEKISKVLSDYYKRQTYLAFLILFPLVGFSIYLQVMIDFPYVFAIGFTLTLAILLLIGFLEEKRLRNQEYMCDLDDKQFKAIQKEYSRAYDMDMSKGKKNFMIIFFTAFTIGIFVISYLIDKS